MNYTKDQQYIIEKLQDLPVETSRAYENYMTDLIMDKNDYMEDEIAAVTAILENEEEKEEIRYACFVMATIYHRRNKNQDKFDALLLRYKNQFDHHDSFKHYYLLSYVDTGYSREWRTILEDAEKNANVMHNAGARHMFAEFVAMIFEDERSDENQKERDYYIESGLDNVNKAIREQVDYAKFYATRGRLRALQGNFHEAEEDIKHAIMIEDSKRSDYAIRIGNYQVRLIEVRQKINTNKLQQAMDAYSEEQNLLYEKMVDESKEISGSLTRNLEYLGIFAGIISFTMGSISIAGSVAKETLIGAAALIIVLFGALSGTYFIFDIIIHGFDKEKKTQYIFTSIIILVAILGGLILCFKI